MEIITLSDINKLTRSGESESVEFKASFNDESLETIGAFANAKAG